MRYVYIGLIAVLAAIVLAFKLQNLDAVTVSLFRASLTLPASLLLTLVYFMGMLTGTLVVALVRNLLRGARASDSTTRA